MYEFDSRVRYSELAADKRLSLVSIINYFQDCCTFEAEEKGVGLKVLDKNHTAWMLINWHIKIDRRPDFNEKIHIKTWACNFRHFIGERNFTITSDDGELLIYSFSRWAYVDTEKGEPVKSIPKEELDAYGISEPLDAEFKKGKIKVPGEMTATDPIKVTAGNLDTNHHVNNGEYMELAMSAVSEYLINEEADSSVSLNDIAEIRAEYKLQSVLGDVIYPYVSMEDKIIYVVLKDDEGNSKLIVELTLSD